MLFHCPIVKLLQLTLPVRFIWLIISKIVSYTIYYYLSIYIGPLKYSWILPRYFIMCVFYTSWVHFNLYVWWLLSNPIPQDSLWGRGLLSQYPQWPKVLVFSLKYHHRERFLEKIINSWSKRVISIRLKIHQRTPITAKISSPWLRGMINWIHWVV